MSKSTDKSFFIVSSLPRFYQQLFSGINSYQQLGNRIIERITTAHAFRQAERIEQLSRLLLNMPSKEYQLIGQYYLFWCKYRNRQYDIDALENIIDRTRTYKAKAMLSRGAFEYDHGRNDAALYFFSEALKCRPSISEYVSISLAIAVAKAAEGFNSVALKEIENLIPTIKHVEAKLYYDFLNSYAVELGEAGRLYEARNICDAVLASPFACAYPEWHQTAQDLRGANRSSVVVNWSQRTPSQRAPANVLMMPLREAGFAAPLVDIQPARILDFEEWKKRTAKGKKGRGKKRREIIPQKGMLLEIMAAYTSETTTDEQRYKMYKAVMKAMMKPKPPAPDDSQGA